MAACVGEGEAEAIVGQAFSERAELPPIGEEVVEPENRDAVGRAARLVAQAVTTPRGESGDPGAAGWPRRGLGAHVAIGSPVSGAASPAGSRAARRRATRAATTSQTSPATSPPQTALAINTG